MEAAVTSAPPLAAASPAAAAVAAAVAAPTTTLATATASAAAGAGADGATTAAAPLSAAAMEAAASMGARATESVKRRGLQLSSELKDFVSGFAAKDSPDVTVPLELKLLSGLVLLFLFLLFLIFLLWDRYGKEIGELYTPNVPTATGETPNEVNANDVADEYTVYQKLPTFFYEYVPSKKKRN